MRLHRFICLVILAFLARGHVAGQTKPIDTCGDRRPDNKFGENPLSYTPKTIVYVYDFSQGVGRRKFYKVTRKKDKTLDVAAVDLNSEILRPGADVYLKVVNINKFMYDISIAESPSAEKSLPGTILTRNSLGDSMILTSWLGTLVNDSEVVRLAVSADLRALYTDVCTFLTDYATEIQKAMKAYSPCRIAPCCDSPEVSGYLRLVQQLINIRTRTIDISTLYDDAKGLLKSTVASLTACLKTNKLLKPLTDIKTPNDAQTKQINDLKAKQCTDDEISVYQARIEKLTAIVASITSVKDMVAHLPTENDLKKLQVFLDNMVKSSQEDLYPLGVGPNGLDLNLTIQPRDSLFNFFGIQARTNISAHSFIPVLGRPQLTFSLGPFAGFPKYLENATYTWQALANNANTVQPGANYILVQSGYTHPAIGVAAMANVEWKCHWSWLGLGASGGAGLSVEQNPRFAGLAGGSLFLGNWRQLVITAGFAAMDINRLTNNWQTVADKQVIYTTQPGLSYYKELRLGGFVSIAVTPFKLSKK
jgi:hypothetical protein